MGRTTPSVPWVHETVRHPWPIFLGALALTVGGFWPEFFSKLPSTPLPHHIHGWSATAWMVLPLLQYALKRNGRRDLHRRVGYWSVALAGIVALSGVYVVRMMAFTNLTTFRLASVKFVWLDLTGIALFGVYVVVAIAAARRRDIRLHVLALIASAFIPLEAALERVFVYGLPAFFPDFDAALYGALVSLEIACAALILVEWRSGRVRWPMPALLAYYVVMHATLTPLATSPGFQRFSDWFALIGRAGS